MIELKNISYRYESSSKPILEDLNLTLRRGEILAIIGSNGTGKSTLLKILTGEVTPHQGNVLRNVGDLKKNSILISHLFQSPEDCLCTEMTVYENLCLSFSRSVPFSLSFFHRRKRKQKLENQLKDWGLIHLWDLRNRVAGRLSGGQKQLLGLVMLLLQKPDVLLLDEPTSALDPQSSQMVFEFLERFPAKKDMAILFISHNLQDVKKFAQKVFELQDGVLISKEFSFVLQ